jgi:hypothetical protein
MAIRKCVAVGTVPRQHDPAAYGMLYLHLPVGTMRLTAGRNDFGGPGTRAAPHEVLRKAGVGVRLSGRAASSAMQQEARPHRLRTTTASETQ